jgi:uncharacterized delta-60 repeat protein
MKKITSLTLTTIVLFILHFSTGFAQPGSLDPTFNSAPDLQGSVNTSAIQSDGKILFGGGFVYYNGITIPRIARLFPNGTLDTSFDSGFDITTSSFLSKLIILDDGKILVVGKFTSYNGTPINNIARLHQDGSLDTTFDPGTGANDYIRGMVIQNDGKIIISGFFTTYDGTPRKNIARLNPDGSLESSFNGTGVSGGGIVDIKIQSDDKVFIGGDFTSYNGTARNRIARLNPDGTLDTSFDPGSGAENNVMNILIQDDGKIIIGGFFTAYDGVARNRIARLNSDGSLDTTFDYVSGTDSVILMIAKQNDGKIIIGGEFTSYNGTAINRIARLNTDGSLDTTFNPGSGPSHNLNTITFQSDGKIIIGGSFTHYDGTPINRIARLNGGTLSIDDFGSSLNNITISPNPANDLVNINNIPDGSTVTVIDMTGKLISTFKNTNNNSSISTTNLVSGIYILKIENNGSVAHKKLIVNN